MLSSAVILFLRLSVLAAFTFLFVVLFEHGPENFLSNVQGDFACLVDFLAAATSSAGGKTSDSGT
ncbi:MAG: hypothetical protein WCQ16_03045 [Verrucomicrobiae bacterium]